MPLNEQSENQNLSLLRRAYRRYSEGGLSDLLRTVGPYITLEIARHQLTSAKTIAETQSGNARIWYGDTDKSITIPPPEHPELRQAFEDYPTEFHPNRPYVCEIPECKMVGERGVSMYQAEKLISETIWGLDIANSSLSIDSRTKLIKEALKSKLCKDRLDLGQCVFPLTGNASYYHWIMEYLPKLRLLELYRSETNREPMIVVNSNPVSYIPESLECAGYDDSAWIQLECVAPRRGKLIIPEHRYQIIDDEMPQNSDYTISYSDINWLRKRMRQSLSRDAVDDSSSRRVYVSRQRVGRRQVANYNKLTDVLSEFEFESHTFEEYSFSKQLRICAEADVFMGPHGAGLVNMIFADNPTVVELFPEETVPPYFYFLSSVCDFDYDAMIFEQRNGKLVVCPERLRENLRRVLT